ncbi:AcrB/AcrD/AcrF family protein [Allosphingosinicella flava]|uniref:AcrB/AcrD/AcrF family protein n=1 Tax=Allosphingosinicella flava TaxID=2771430 RepID=A0A7T2GIR9_9SPHN|nr:AcrB/AcrD/AcrF family protein [Sphingosinicella flava]QPQ54628.1 AcrB/AcrD/AcrF family protein [Sphingosinicella flava]
MADGIEGWAGRHWRWLTALAFILVAAWLLYQRWALIQGFAPVDTDDHMRIMQVRAWLAGQGWFDLRQYRMDPPYGANIHWSRIPDLPIAGLILLLKPFFGGAMAEKAALSLAPFLPMAVTMTAIAILARRLLSPPAFALGIAILFCAASVRGMWMPLRVDHHGWQLAFLSLVMLGLADDRRARGGLTVGIATALSLAVGLEMLLYLALAGAAIGLMWVRDGGEARRLAAYGASLATGTALGYLLFASHANRLPVCDALSPVWLSAMSAAGALSVLLGLFVRGGALQRLGLAALGGAALAAGFALAWPDCLGRLEGVPPELQRLWLDNVKEARPVYTHNLQTIVMMTTLPLMGLIGYAMMLWRTRRDGRRLTRWAALAALALVAAALLLWQTRAAAAAQLLAVPGAAALAWILVPLLRRRASVAVRLAGVALLFALITGVGPQWIASRFAEKPGPMRRAVGAANTRCPSIAALRPIARQPRGYVLTFVDLGPRLITMTHHDAVAGPYHRNAEAILDVQRAFRGSAANARATVARRGIDYVLICPNLSESTIYKNQAPKGFYAQLAAGEVPGWLQPVPLPKDNPYKMWRVVKPGS